jgi:hypothetical protein
LDIGGNPSASGLSINIMEHGKDKGPKDSPGIQSERIDQVGKQTDRERRFDTAGKDNPGRHPERDPGTGKEGVLLGVGRLDCT